MLSNDRVSKVRLLIGLRILRHWLLVRAQERHPGAANLSTTLRTQENTAEDERYLDLQTS